MDEYKWSYSEELGNWLDEICTWDWWMTFTSPYPRSTKSWRRMMRKYCAHVSPDRVFWACEQGKLGRWHIHALMQNVRVDPAELCRQLRFSRDLRGSFDHSDDVEWMLWRLGRMLTDQGRAHVSRFQPGKGASHYCGKYVTKDLADYDFWTVVSDRRGF